MPVRIATAILLAAASVSGATKLRNLDCSVRLESGERNWSIRIGETSARPECARYDRIAASTSPTQFVSSRLSPEHIEIDIRDGNAGEHFDIARATGIIGYEQLIGLDHSGTESVTARTTGRCTLR